MLVLPLITERYARLAVIASPFAHARFGIDAQAPSAAIVAATIAVRTTLRSVL
jgi:hypothetical protein